MKFKIIWIYLIVIVVSVPSICFSEQSDSKVKKTTYQLPDSKVWEYFGYNSYYNKKTLTKLSDIISVWTYTITRDDLRKETIEYVKKFDLEKSIKYQNFDHFISLYEIDCKNRLTKYKESTDYDDQGNILDHQTNQDIEWKNVKPYTIREGLYNDLCVTQKKPLKKK